jgi:DNA-binding PadR family transcriptional regulator
MSATFRPSDVVLQAMPLIGTFGHAEAEAAAALIVLACVDAGDEWKPLTLAELQATFERHYNERPWMRVPFLRPDLNALAREGYALMSTNDAGKKCIALSQLGLEQLARWVRTTLDDAGDDS